MSVIDYTVPLFNSYCDLFRTLGCLLIVVGFVLMHLRMCRKCRKPRPRSQGRRHHLFDESSEDDHDDTSSQNGGESIESLDGLDATDEFQFIRGRPITISTMNDPPPPYES